MYLQLHGYGDLDSESAYATVLNLTSPQHAHARTLCLKCMDSSSHTLQHPETCAESEDFIKRIQYELGSILLLNVCNRPISVDALPVIQASWHMHRACWQIVSVAHFGPTMTPQQPQKRGASITFQS